MSSDNKEKQTAQKTKKGTQPTLKALPSESLKDLIQKGLDSKYRVFAPVKTDDLVTFEQITSPEEAFLEGITTRMSPKSLLFPRTETVFSYRIRKEEILVQDRDADFAPPTILFGCRPCDAASFPIMDRLFQWDYQDRFWNERRKSMS